MTIFKKILSVTFALYGTVCQAQDTLNDLYPAAFDGYPKMPVTGCVIAGVDGYSVNKFTGNGTDRNHYDSRNGARIEHLVMHYTHFDLAASMDVFTKDIPDGRASAHYAITQTESHNNVPAGVPIRIVEDDLRAWHAGVSAWRGTINLNASSLGIENINRGFDGVDGPNHTPDRWYGFESAQIETLGKLSQSLVQKYNIKPYNVVGHADISPLRKQDPGILFPWEHLYTKYGVGAWLTEREQNPDVISKEFLPREPLVSGVSDAFFLNCLQNYGYHFQHSGYITPELSGVVKTFKSHFSHNQDVGAYSEVLDEKAMVWAFGLSSKYNISLNYI